MAIPYWVKSLFLKWKEWPIFYSSRGVEVFKSKFRFQLSQLLSCLYLFRSFQGGAQGVHNRSRWPFLVWVPTCLTLVTLWLKWLVERRGRVMQVPFLPHFCTSEDWHEYKELGELGPKRQGEVHRWPQWWCLEETIPCSKKKCQGEDTHHEDAPWRLKPRHKN